MITFDIAHREPKIRRELNRVKRLGHAIPHFEVKERAFRRTTRNSFAATEIVAKGRCEKCGGTMSIVRDLRSTEADALTVAGDVLAMECI